MDLHTTDPLAFIALGLAIGVVITNIIYILSTKVWYRWIKLPYIIACFCATLVYLYTIFVGHAPGTYSRLLNIITYAAMLTGSISSLGRVTNWFCVFRKKSASKLPSIKYIEGEDCG